MTDIASALNAGQLGEFEGRTVLSVGIEIPGAAGGLRDALKIDPVTFHQDDEVLVLIRGKVGKLRFDPVKDTQGVSRIHVLQVEDATIVDGDAFDAALDEQKAKIDRARERSQGTQRLALPDELEAQHKEGEHEAGLVDGCPMCQDELDAMEVEANG